MDFVFTLHSHLPYVLNHGRWPHGSDWICEAAVDTYLPLLEAFRRLDAEAIPARVTIGFTPVLANQLANPLFARELESFLAQRLAACAEAPASLAATGESHLLPLVEYWRARLLRLRRLFEEVEGDLISGFRELEAAGRLEIIGSAATHGFLPLLARDESIRLQLAVGMAEHRRLFGRAPAGCWLPECAYRPRGPWAPWPTAPRSGVRRGIEEHLADAGFRFFFVDAHLAAAGRALGLSGDPAALDPRRTGPAADPRPSRCAARRTCAYRVAHGRGAGDVTAYVRDPRASMQVWSRFEGYPGDAAYLEFHKMRWPGGLKLWRVSGPSVDLGAKEPYDPATALDRARGHAHHFAGLLGEIAGGQAPRRDGVIVAPFDTELFGHWWFEGPDFLRETYRALRGRNDVRPDDRLRASRPPSGPHRHPDAGRLVGRQRRFQHVAERPDGVDLGAALAPRGAVLGRGARARSRPSRRGRCWHRPLASCCWRSRPTGSSSSRPGPPRTTASGVSASTAPTPKSWSRPWRTDRRTHSSAAAAGPRRSPSATCSFPTSSRPSPRHSAARAPSCSGSPWRPSGSLSGCICISLSATSIMSSPSTWTTCIAR